MSELITNKWLWIPLITWFLVQVFKVIRELLRDKKINFKRIWGAGGMPSAHTACVSSFATAVGLGVALPAVGALFVTFPDRFDVLIAVLTGRRRGRVGSIFGREGVGSF